MTGAGQTVGLFEAGPYNLSDVLLYFKNVNQPLNVPIVNELIDGGGGTCGADCDDSEQVVDVIEAVSMAPGLSAVIVYLGPNQVGVDTDIFNAMATDNIAKQLSVSWSFGTDAQGDEPIFQEFAAQGQSLLAASGDNGAYGPGGALCDPGYSYNVYPASDPYATAVGGTDLTTTGPGGAWQSEVAWVDSTGGVGTLPIPSYQAPAIDASNQGSTTLRNVPDVAAEANSDNYSCDVGSCDGGWGGTSLAAPRWAGFVALANEQANGYTAGFLNPAIYQLGLGPNYGSVMHDITVGNNFDTCSPAMFQAVPGYDLVTGWGSPAGQALLNVFGPVNTGPNFSFTASPSTISVTPGNNNVTSTITLCSLNGFASTVNLSMFVPAGVTASLNPSSLTGAGAATLSLSTTSSTPSGTYPVGITGRASGLTQTAYVTLGVEGFSLSAPRQIFLNQSGSASATIAVNAVGLFSGNVKFSVSGLPSGVTASFDPASAASCTQLNLKASAKAATGYATLTITGISGGITATTNLTLAMSAATGTGGNGVPVDLSAAYNVHGIYTNGSTYNSGGMDQYGNSYSEELLTPSRVASGEQFNFGPANKADAVSGRGKAIALPAGKYARLNLLATGVNGPQTGQTITVTYTDGTTSKFTQSFANWTAYTSYPGQIVAVAMPYWNYLFGNEEYGTVSLYEYAFALDKTKKVQSFTLPNNFNVVMLAATLFK